MHADAKLAALIDNAPRFVPVAEPQPAQVREAAPLPNYATFADLSTNPPPARRWVIEEWLPVGSVTALFGSGGVGKSLLVQQAGTCVANGVPLFGLDVQRGPVLGYFCEDDNDELRRRQRDILAAYARTPEYSSDGLYLEGRAGLHNCLMTATADRLMAPTAFLRTIDAECERIQPTLVILDNIAQLYGGLENDRFQVTVFCNELTGLARRHDCAVLLLGHVAKAEGSEYSGSTAWEAAVRTRLWLERLEDGSLALHKRKANYSARESVGMTWQAGAFVATVTDAGAAPGAQPAEVQQASEIVLQALDTYTARQIATSQNPTARTFLPSLARKDNLLTGTTYVLARRALDMLIDSGEIVVDQPLGWKKADRHIARGLARRPE